MQFGQLDPRPREAAPVLRADSHAHEVSLPVEHRLLGICILLLPLAEPRHHVVADAGLHRHRILAVVVHAVGLADLNGHMA